ncbi:MAG TPA: FAD-dependent oxidoreductase [bacterium]|nr:FAD-dependent oxidoreductase [bacterium]
MESYDILVIGGGPAGISIAKIINGQKKVGIIRPEEHSMIYCAMPYVIEDIIPGTKALKKDSLVTGSGADLIRDRVVSVDFNLKEVHTAGGNSYRYEKLVIATGAIPIMPPIEGTDKEGVGVFKTETDMSFILGKLQSGVEKAVVVGAGAIGIELAQALSDRGLEVHLVDIAESVLPNLVDPDMATDLGPELERKGIHLHLGRKVIAIEGNGAAQGVRLDDDSLLKLSGPDYCSVDTGPTGGLVLFSVGMRPDLEIFKDTILEIGRDGIFVDDKMQTSIRDVYAVGDCAQFTSGITGEIVSGKLATNAVPMAKLLARNLMGDTRSYPGFFNGAATRVGNFFVGGTGLSESAAERAGFQVVSSQSELTTQFPIMPDAKPVKVKLIADRNNRKLLGAQVVSGAPVTDRIDLLTFAIQKQSTVDELSALSYSAQPYQAFFPANNSIVQAAENIIRFLN